MIRENFEFNDRMKQQIDELAKSYAFCDIVAALFGKEFDLEQVLCVYQYMSDNGAFRYISDEALIERVQELHSKGLSDAEIEVKLSSENTPLNAKQIENCWMMTANKRNVWSANADRLLTLVYHKITNADMCVMLFPRKQNNIWQHAYRLSLSSPQVLFSRRKEAKLAKVRDLKDVLKNVNEDDYLEIKIVGKVSSCAIHSLRIQANSDGSQSLVISVSPDKIV